MTSKSTINQYLIVTGNYWAFTLTDGAMRMLVLLHFHAQGFSPLQLALVFVSYEAFSVVTNLLGGWLAQRVGLTNTMQAGLTLQIAALAMLLVPTQLLTVGWMMAAQGLSGIAKDLNKMSAKSSVKFLVAESNQGKDTHGILFRWVAFLTGSKNALKGAGFFLGGALLSWLGFGNAVLTMIVGLVAVLLISLLLLRGDLGKVKKAVALRQLLSKSTNINNLSAARLLLFAARDVWFVIAVPVYLAAQLNWSYHAIGLFFALWIIGYGFIQAIAPAITRATGNIAFLNSAVPTGAHASSWALLLTVCMAVLSCFMVFNPTASAILIAGLLIFGAIFAVNSSVHSFLIVHYAAPQQVAADVGFYYMANAGGRLLGTFLSGLLYQLYGLAACLVMATLMLIGSTLISFRLPR